MKRVLRWLATKFSRHSATVEADERQTPVGVSVRPIKNVEEEHSVESGLDAGVPERVESQEPGKDIPMPNIDDGDDTITHLQLEPLDESSLDANESRGYNPYDTGSLDTSKTSGSRSRK